MTHQDTKELGQQCRLYLKEGAKLDPRLASLCMLPLSREDGEIKPIQEGKESLPVRKKIPFYLISAFIVHVFPSNTKKN